MKHSEKPIDCPSAPRERAKIVLELQSGNKLDPTQLSPDETQRLIHELRVHQIELLIQNGELQKIESELKKTRDEYTDLYDHAPAGYLTLNEKGIIIKANLTLAKLLGIERAQLINTPLIQFVGSDAEDSYYLFFNQLLDGKENQTAELKLKKCDNLEFYAQLESNISENSDNSFRQFRIMITEITGYKQAEDAPVKKTNR